jgi:photosystem II stability/assembly factor-like uncharacterized protein
MRSVLNSAGLGAAKRGIGIRPAIAGFGLFFIAATGLCAEGSSEPRAAEMMPKASTSILLDVASASGRYVAVGEHGNIVTSPNGKDWTQVAAPVRSMLNRVRFLDDKQGWAVGHDGVILHTGDGGTTWTLQARDIDKGIPFYDVLFLDGQHGFAVGAKALMKETTDGGKTWTDVSAPFLDTGLNLNTIVRLHDGSLLIAGEKGLVANSNDSGRTWTMLRSPYPGSWFGALPAGAGGVLVYGLRGHIYAIDDPKAVPAQDPKQWDEFSLPTITDADGLHKLGWRAFNAPSEQSLFGGTLLDDTHFALVGVNGTVLRGVLSNAALTAVSAPSNFTLSSIVVHDGKGIAVGHDGVEAIDGGLTP